MSHNHSQESEVRREKQREKQRLNKIWLWIGVIVLCAILLFWLFDIGTFIGPNQ